MGASVFWTYGKTTTNSAGAFSISVWTNHHVDLTAEMSRYAYQTIGSDAPSITWTPAFVLRYAISAPSRVAMLQSDGSYRVSFAVYSTAPQLGTSVKVQIPQAAGWGLVPLSFDTAYSSPGGWSKWVGFWLAPDPLSEGSYPFKACAINGPDASSCDSSVGLMLALTSSSGQVFEIDRTPPTVNDAAVTPAPYSDVTSVGTISVPWTDAFAGVNNDSLSMSIDGMPVGGSIEGSIISWSGSSLAPGVHVVSVSGKDLAGNQAQRLYIFTLTTVEGSAATASLQSRSIPVPVGATSITFTNLSAESTRYTVTLNASTRVGAGTILRPLSLPNLEVTFSNGTDSTTRSVGAIAGSYSAPLWVVAPSAGPLTAVVPEGSVLLPDVTVSVPAGFSGAGVTATLAAASSVLGNVSLQAPLFATNLPSPYDLAVYIENCVRVTDFCSSSGSKYAAHAYNPATNDWSTSVAVPSRTPLDDGPTALDPGCLTTGLSGINACGQMPPSNTWANTAFSCPRNSPNSGSDTCGQSNLGIPDKYGTADAAGSGVALGCDAVVSVEAVGDVPLCDVVGQPTGDLVSANSNLFTYAASGCYMNGQPSCVPQDPVNNLGVWAQDVVLQGSMSCPNGRSEDSQGSSATATITRISSNYASPIAPDHVATTAAYNGVDGMLAAGGQLWGAELGSTNSLGNSTPDPDPSAGYSVKSFFAFPPAPAGSSYEGATGAWIGESGSRVPAGTQVEDPVTGNTHDTRAAAAAWWPAAGTPSPDAGVAMFSGVNVPITSTADAAVTVLLTAVFHVVSIC